MPVGGAGILGSSAFAGRLNTSKGRRGGGGKSSMSSNGSGLGSWGSLAGASCQHDSCSLLVA